MNTSEEMVNNLIIDNIENAMRIANRAGRRMPRAEDREDLRSAAMVGLVEAANAFDPSLTTPFMGYASRRITGAIRDAQRKSDHLTRRQREKVSILRGARAELVLKLGRDPMDSEVDEILGAGPAKIARELEEIDLQRINDEISHHASPTEPPDELCEIKFLSERVAEEVLKLPETGRFALVAHGYLGSTLKEAGDALGVTESRMSQARAEAIRLLRQAFGVDPTPPSEPRKKRADAGKRRKPMKKRLLSVEQVRMLKIKSACGVRNKDLAAEYGIHRSSVSSIIHGRMYAS